MTLLGFMEGGRDARGRSHAEILGWSDAELERHHDYIQWLFPLADPSRAVPGSPVLGEAERRAIAASPVARAAIERATARMLRFYRNSDHWLTAYDHNHLRISRIIHSLRLLSGDGTADAFRAKIMALVEQAGSPVDRSALHYWKAA